MLSTKLGNAYRMPGHNLCHIFFKSTLVSSSFQFYYYLQNNKQMILFIFSLATIIKDHQMPLEMAANNFTDPISYSVNFQLHCPPCCSFTALETFQFQGPLHWLFPLPGVTFLRHLLDFLPHHLKVFRQMSPSQ